MRFLRTYARVLLFLGRDLRIAGLLAGANLMVAGLQFLDPVLFGRVVNLLSRSDKMPHAAFWHHGRDPARHLGLRSGWSASAATSWSRCRPSAWRTATASAP